MGSGNYGPGFPYLGGFSYVGGGPTFGYVPFGFVDPLHFQNQLIGQFNAIQRQIANQARLYHFFYYFIFSYLLPITVFYVFIFHFRPLISFFGKQSIT